MSHMEWLGYDPERGDIHGYTSEQMAAKDQEIRRLQATVDDWLYANGPTGWIEQLRQKQEQLEADLRDLDDALVVRHLNPRQPGESLRSCLNRILDWEVTVQLDPAVSSAARALVESGRVGPVARVYRYGKDSAGRPWHGINPIDDVDIPDGTLLYAMPSKTTGEKP